MQELFDSHNEHPVADIGQVFLTQLPLDSEYPGEQRVHVEELEQFAQFAGQGMKQAT